MTLTIIVAGAIGSVIGSLVTMLIYEKVHRRN